MTAVPAERIVPTEPGVYPGLSFAEYYDIRAANHSTLEGFTRTPRHARERTIHPPESTPDLALGHGFHVFTLEPDRFMAEYAVAPKCNRRYKEGQAIWAKFEAENPGKVAVDEDEFRNYYAMRQSIMEHPTARELMGGGRGVNELTIVWRDSHTGLLCKARIDRLGELGSWPFIVDLKTTRDAAERPFSRDVAQYGYHRQLAWYREGLDVLRPGLRRCAIVAVEKTPPFCVAVHELDERAIEQGAREVRHHINTYWDCVRSGEWPGYPGGLSLIDLPPWAVDGGE
jgi:exodeoxyribonuclease VIII